MENNDVYTKEQESMLEESVEVFDSMISQRKWSGAQTIIDGLKAGEFYTAADKLSIELATKTLYV